MPCSLDASARSHSTSAPYQLIFRQGRTDLRAVGRARTPQRQAQDQPKDPVCGMTVSPPSAKYSYTHHGDTFYFCCASCLEKFKRDPEAYLKLSSQAATVQLSRQDLSSAAERPNANVSYVCPMCPEVRSSHRAPCPKCGMALEPDTPALSSRVEYTCPMHPEIVRSEPGACPICGMALEPRTVTQTGQVNPELRDMTRRLWVRAALTLPAPPSCRC